MIVGTETDEDIVCPINTVIDIFSRKWVFGILKDMFLGKKHFSEFKEDKPKLNNNMLADTLKFLEEKELIYKTNTNKRDTEYYLTDKGKKINKILYEMVIFGLYILEDDKRPEELKQQIKQEYQEILNIKDI